MAKDEGSTDVSAQTLPGPGLLTDNPIARLAHQAAASNPVTWGVDSFKREDIADHMVRVDCENRSTKNVVPADFQGLFWMDGNLMSEKVASYGHSTWTPGVEGCRESKTFFYTQEERNAGIVLSPFNDSVPCLGRLDFPIWEDRTWAIPSGVSAAAQHFGGATISFTGSFVCGGRDPNYLTVCKVGAHANGPGATGFRGYALNAFQKISTDLMWAWLFYMVRVSDDLWVRYSASPRTTPLASPGNPHQYFAKRLVDCAGRRVEPHCSEFVSNGKATDEFSQTTDVFGHRLKQRKHVASVPSSLMVRVNRFPHGEGLSDKNKLGAVAAQASGTLNRFR